ncbi:MAG: hypothetical protein AAGA96_03460 [Verrucomicrobiota bacterium]
MKVNRLIAWILIGVAVVPLVGAIVAFLSGGFVGIKGIGSYFFAAFFLGITGWLIGDF